MNDWTLTRWSAASLIKHFVIVTRDTVTRDTVAYIV